MAEIQTQKNVYESESLFKKRIRRFKQIKRGYYSFWIIVVLYFLSFFSSIIFNNKALLVKYDGDIYFPLLKHYSGEVFGQDVLGEANYRNLKIDFKYENKGNWVMMPPYPYGPFESLVDKHPIFRKDDVRDPFKLMELMRNPNTPISQFLSANLSDKSRGMLSEWEDWQTPNRGLIKSVLADFNKIVNNESLINKEFADKSILTDVTSVLSDNIRSPREAMTLNRFIIADLMPGVFAKNRQPPTPPSRFHWFGTDDRGRDVFVRIVYGFNISLSFALLVVLGYYIIGIGVGASLGYFGGRFDIIAQRFIEIWGSIPFLYTVMIISSIISPNFSLLAALLIMFSWTGITYFMRGEFYREKAKDYVHSAIAIGASDKKIIFKHILPNALTPIITFAPFAIVGGISSLVSLDYLGFGLPPPTPSWGELVGQGMANIFSWWLVLFPLGALFLTLMMVVFIGEAIRQAFDPREFSRLR